MELWMLSGFLYTNLEQNDFRKSRSSNFEEAIN